MQLRHIACAIALAFPLAVNAATSGINKDNFDPQVRIQDDLYTAVNGGWMQRTEIPADKTSWGAFHQLRDLSEQRVHGIIESAAGNATDPKSKQIADLYASFMNEAEIEKQSLSPIKPLLTEIEQIKQHGDLTKQFGALQLLGLNLPIRLDVRVDAKDSNRYLLHVLQGGLGLPDRDYYLEKDERFAKARDAYMAYLGKLLVLSGTTEDVAGQKAQAIVVLESKLARIQWSVVENRDPQKTYNKYDLARLKKLTPGVDFKSLLVAAEASSINEINVSQPSYQQALAKLVTATDIAVWRDYLRIRAIDRFAPMLPEPFVKAHFNFHEAAIAGAKEQRPRWKRGVEFVESQVTESVGQFYVAQYFPPESKQKMEVLVSNLLKAYAQSIDNLTWMSPATKAAAHDKLGRYTVKIGYPSKWRDYSGLAVKANDLIGNTIRGAQFEYRFDLARLNKPVDREEWCMPPQMVNAYYNPSKNEIVFPAAILQPPFFDANADDAINYGGIGAVIGHEISHGFDDQGSQYDGHGNMKNWWQKEDQQAFRSLTEQLVAQYNQYEPIAGRFVNGQLTLGENIADLSGLQIAYKAYQLSLGGKPAESIDGFTGDQRFFIGFAQIWRNKTRDARALQLLTIDPHSPAQYRPVGAVVNSDAFMAAFGVQPGDGMFKPEKERIRIW
ncbi:M13 family metallopeptidase [Chitinimonas sp. PSY-7]|uniref:M13-type metalloendopeptidase n=1 Tax=Chitinimonas sp. PSY-7 TaxID=3459088 RepID=UPI0040402131